MTEPIATAPETAAEQSITSEQRMAELEARLAAAEAEVTRLGEEFLRAKAETENTRRRAADDVARAHKFGIEMFAASMLPVRDSLEAALAVESASVESLREGVQITSRQLATAFEKAGLAEVSPMGQKFDPHRHQALSQVESGEEPNTVITVVQKGYVLYDRVIRPALVMVAKEKSAPTPPSA